MTDKRLLDALTRANAAYGEFVSERTPEHPWLGDPAAWYDSMTASGYRILKPDFSRPHWLAVQIQDAVVAGRAGGGAFDAEACAAVFREEADDMTLRHGKVNVDFLHDDEPDPDTDEYLTWSPRP